MSTKEEGRADESLRKNRGDEESSRMGEATKLRHQESLSEALKRKDSSKEKLPGRGEDKILRKRGDSFHRGQSCAKIYSKVGTRTIQRKLRTHDESLSFPAGTANFGFGK